MTAPRRCVLGLDGCKRGWVGVRLDLDQVAPPAARFYWIFDDALTDSDAPAVIAVDMPIGFLDVAQRGGRLCERLARHRLGPRRNSVFSAPTRAAFAHAYDYGAALEANRAGGEIGLSRQCFHLIPKLKEIDALMTPTLQQRVRESHPELVFTVLNGGRPMRFAKKTRSGHLERIRLLTSAGEASASTESSSILARTSACAAAAWRATTWSMPPRSRSRRHASRAAKRSCSHRTRRAMRNG